MGFTITNLKDRFTNELFMLGTFTDAVKTSVIQDAVMGFCRDVDKPVINANLTVTASKGPYDIPATIDKLYDVYNNAATPIHVIYTADLTKRQITFKDAPTAGAFVCYGTPYSIRTNLSAVIAGMPENYEDVVWSYVRALAFRQAGDINMYSTELKISKMLAKDLRGYINRMLDQTGMTVNFIDTRGYVIADTNNKEGISVDIPDFLEQDL